MFLLPSRMIPLYDINHHVYHLFHWGHDVAMQRCNHKNRKVQRGRFPGRHSVYRVLQDGAPKIALFVEIYVAEFYGL